MRRPTRSSSSSPAARSTAPRPPPPPPPPILDTATALDLDEAHVYAPYFDVETVFEPGPFAPPPLEGYFDRIVDYARRARGGKRGLSRSEARPPPVGGSAAVRAGAPAFGTTG